MIDLISRHEAIDAIHEDIEWLVEQGGRDLELPECMERAKTILGDLPSAEPEIIRCEECKHSERWYRNNCRCFLWSETGIGVFEDGFCNYAERRADE